jgi:FKBP-type peptidyl-prolyl cis-trans isomerase
MLKTLAIGLLLAATAASAQQSTFSPPPDLANPPADAVKSPSGLISKVVTPGSGPKPAATDMVTVHYTGWVQSDGRMFDSSRSRGPASTFPLDRVFAGWRECVQLMVVGETRRCWLPQELAYKGAEGRPAGTVVFDIELVDTQPNPRTAPEDVKAPPADAKKTASGLAYKVLRPGTGIRRPSSFSRVTVHYTGWTTDGKMFDSSLVKGAPITLPLDEFIPGWSEGVQLMVEGERTRLWIPESLAYKGERGQPRGMLVFDVELIRIE